MPQFIRALKIGVGKQRTVLQEIEGLQVSFKIEQSNTAEPNAADISITNLSPSSIAALEEKSSEIFLNVGYTSAESLLFWGNDLDVETTKQGVDRVTQIKAKDGGKQLAESSANISIPRGTDLSQVVRKIVGTMENITLSQTELTRLLGIAPAKNGAIISASSREALTKVLSSLGYSWSIQNGEVKITKAGDIPPPSKIIELSAASGLLGTPSKTKTGIRFRALLNPKITPATPVSIISATLSGLAYDPVRDRIYVASGGDNGRGIDYTDDGGVNWSHPNPHSTQIKFSAAYYYGGTIYACGNRGASWSDDGDNWTDMNLRLEYDRHRDIFAV